MSGPSTLIKNPRLARAVWVADYVASVAIAFAGTYMTICALVSRSPFPNIIFDLIVMAVGIFFSIAACESRRHRMHQLFQHRWH